jgi:predicted Zn-dependent protease
MGLAGRLGVAVPALAVLAWAGFGAARTGEADSVVYAAATEVSTWTALAASPQPATVDSVRAELDRVDALASRNAALHELQGVLALARAGRGGDLDPAIERLAASLRERPGSAYTWAHYARALYGKGDTGASYELALRRASELGPHEPQVQRTVADLGLATYDDSTTSTRKAVESMVANGMARDPRETLQIAQRRGRLAIACGYLPQSSRNDPEAARACLSTEAT